MVGSIYINLIFLVQMMHQGSGMGSGKRRNIK